MQAGGGHGAPSGLSPRRRIGTVIKSAKGQQHEDGANVRDDKCARWWRPRAMCSGNPKRSADAAPEGWRPESTHKGGAPSPPPTALTSRRGRTTPAWIASATTRSAPSRPPQAEVGGATAGVGWARPAQCQNEARQHGPSWPPQRELLGLNTQFLSLHLRDKTTLEPGGRETDGGHNERNSSSQASKRTKWPVCG